MSEQEQDQTEQGGGAASSTAVRALAAAAATGAATYAVRKALASRNGHDQAEDEDENDAGVSERELPEDSTEDEADNSEDTDDGDDDEYELEGSADEDDEDDPDEQISNGSDGPRVGGSLRQRVNPAMLGSASHLLLPVAEAAADSAGRYIAEHGPDAVRERVVPRFIHAFEDAS